MTDAELSTVELRPGLQLAVVKAGSKIYLVRTQVHSQLCSHVAEHTFDATCYPVRRRAIRHHCKGQLLRDLKRLGACKRQASSLALISLRQALDGCAVSPTCNLPSVCCASCLCTRRPA